MLTTTNFALQYPESTDAISIIPGTLSTSFNYIDAHMATTDTTQTVSGIKNFSGAPIFSDTYTTGNPTLPASGFKWFSRNKGGRPIPCWVAPDGQDTSIQPAFFANSIHLYVANTGLNTATQYGWTPTVSALTLVSPAATNFFTMMSRVRMTSAATAGSMVEWRNAVAEFTRHSTAGLGGWYFVARFGIATTVSGNRVFVGLNSSTAAMTNVDPSTLLNIVGFGCNTAQTTMQVYTNDGSGTATMTNLGANFPMNTSSTDFYECRMFVPSGNTTYINWSVERLNTGDFASGQITTDMPAASTLLAPHVWHSNGTTASAVSLDLQQIYMETDN